MSIHKVCFLGGTRYSRPLDPTNERKFRVLANEADVYVVGFSRNLLPRYFRQFGDFYLLPRLPSPLLRYAESFLAGLILVLWLVIRHQVQIIIAQSPYEGFAGACAKSIAKRLGRPTALVVESHGDFEESLFLQRRVRPVKVYRFVMKCVTRFAFDRADVFRSVSTSTAEQLRRWSPETPIHRFITWTDIGVFLEAGLNRDPRHDCSILYAGVLIPRKGVHYLVDAFARVASDFPAARLLIVGSQENRSYTAALRSQVEGAGLEDRVHFLSPVSQGELATLMSRACVLVLPTMSEGLPRVLVEAMATGTPTIGSRVSGIPDVVRDGETGFLVPHGDAGALTERLRWILDHATDAQAMGRRARAFVESNFSTSAYVAAYRQLFDAAQMVLERTGD